jgi:hypothetical protein
MVSQLIAYPPNSQKVIRAEVYAAPQGPNSSLINVPSESFLLVGGQNGTWFAQSGQWPRLYAVNLQNDSTARLTPVRGVGTVWGGGFNGSQALVSGWGTDDDSYGPYVCLLNGTDTVTDRSLDYYGDALSWNGGDIFAASYNGKDWLLSGLGSGPASPDDQFSTNHMSLGTFNGTVFSDLSNLIPNQRDAILYANAWNGQYWLIGGGYLTYGTLFTFNGKTITDLTAQAKEAIPGFASVQSIGWNGAYWLIGGNGFLAEFDGRNFIDLTQQLKDSLSTNNFYSVNAMAWNGQAWLIGGGTPVGQLGPGHAWFATYTSSGLARDSSALPLYISNVTQTSSILTITSVNGIWILGGYSGDQGTLFAYNDKVLTDYSNLVTGMTYVNWATSLQNLAF